MDYTADIETSLRATDQQAESLYLVRWDGHDDAMNLHNVLVSKKWVIVSIIGISSLYV